MVTEQITYKHSTQSLDEFALALALGAEIVEVDRLTDPRFFTFHLKGNFNIEEATLALASKSIKVNAHDLFDAMRRAKSVVHRRPAP